MLISLADHGEQSSIRFLKIDQNLKLGSKSSFSFSFGNQTLKMSDTSLSLAGAHQCLQASPVSPPVWYQAAISTFYRASVTKGVVLRAHSLCWRRASFLIQQIPDQDQEVTPFKVKTVQNFGSQFMFDTNSPINQKIHHFVQILNFRVLMNKHPSKFSPSLKIKPWWTQIPSNIDQIQHSDFYEKNERNPQSTVALELYSISDPKLVSLCA